MQRKRFGSNWLRSLGIVAGCLLVVGLVLVGTGNRQAATLAADTCQTFSETGHQVCGKFLSYWLSHGGLAQQGLPLSDVFEEKNADPPAGDGKVHKVQYFQRARFEEHLENQPPYDVLLGLLGAEQYQAKYKGQQPAGGALVVNGKRTMDKIDIFTPKAGKTFLILDFTLTNNSGKDLTANSLYLQVQTDKGFNYRPADGSYSLDRDLKLSDLKPGESIRAELAYDIPDGEVAKTLYYDNGFDLKFSTPIP